MKNIYLILLSVIFLGACDFSDEPTIDVIHMDNNPEIGSLATDCPVDLNEYCLIGGKWQVCFAPEVETGEVVK